MVNGVKRRRRGTEAAWMPACAGMTGIDEGVSDPFSRIALFPAGRGSCLARRAELRR